MTDVLIASGGKAQRVEKALCLGVEPGSFSHNSKKKMPECWEPPGWKRVKTGFCPPSYTVGGNAHWCSHSGKEYGGSPKGQK